MRVRETPKHPSSIPIALWLLTLTFTSATSPTKTRSLPPALAHRQDIPPQSPTVPIDSPSPTIVTVIETESSTLQQAVLTTSLNPDGVNDARPTSAAGTDSGGGEGNTAGATGTETSHYPEISSPSQIGMIMPNPDTAVYAGEHFPSP